MVGSNLLRNVRLILVMLLALSLISNHIPFGVSAPSEGKGTYRLVKEPISYHFVGLNKSECCKPISFVPNTFIVHMFLIVSILRLGFAGIFRKQSSIPLILRRLFLAPIKFTSNYVYA